MPKAYLTIDDSPSMRMDDLVDAFAQRAVPALFFCRGDYLEKNPIAAVRAVERGFVLGNHGFSHVRAADAPYEKIIAEIEKTERLIDNIYNTAGMDKPGQYFRFPHLDRGCGSWILDYEALDIKIRNKLRALFTEGLNTISMKTPDAAALEKKERLQSYLKENGYSVPFTEANIAWLKTPEIAGAQDCLFTYSTSDWMVTQRHIEKWRYKSLQDLKDKIDHDEWLIHQDSVSIVLAHDQAEIIDVTLELVDHMIARGVEFLPYS